MALSTLRLSSQCPLHELTTSTPWPAAADNLQRLSSALASLSRTVGPPGGRSAAPKPPAPIYKFTKDLQIHKTLTRKKEVAAGSPWCRSRPRDDLHSRSQRPRICSLPRVIPCAPCARLGWLAMHRGPAGQQTSNILLASVYHRSGRLATPCARTHTTLVLDISTATFLRARNWELSERFCVFLQFWAVFVWSITVRK